ncbi:DUF4229 domain-containing protein [Nocardia lasii]|uniref:DUF4229 domain-containing protein n=1 Tax=Nocardia lasii TaxID=1616107 RepID=A0ABW1JZQ5_9NOCA
MSEATGQQDARKRLARNLALYTLARIGLVVLIAALIVGVATLIGVEVPIIVAALFALIVAMPLSLTLTPFKNLRVRVNEDIAVVDERRRQDKAQLRARLRGDDDSSSA